MIHARIEKRETGCVVIVYSESLVLSETPFKTADEAEHFLLVAGWDKVGSASWWRLDKTHGSFVAMPILINTLSCWDRLSEFKFGEYGVFIQTNNCSLHVYSFYFCVHRNSAVINVGDPVLSLVGNDHVEIQSVGCWFTEEEAVNMAEFFFRRLEKRYGRELFSEAIRAYILRNLYREKTR